MCNFHYLVQNNVQIAHWQLLIRTLIKMSEFKQRFKNKFLFYSILNSRSHWAIPINICTPPVEEHRNFQGGGHFQILGISKGWVFRNCGISKGWAFRDCGISKGWAFKPWNFQRMGLQKLWNFQGIGLQKLWNFQGMGLQTVEFPRDGAFRNCGNSKKWGLQKLWNFQGMGPSETGNSKGWRLQPF